MNKIKLVMTIIAVMVLSSSNAMAVDTLNLETNTSEYQVQSINGSGNSGSSGVANSGNSGVTFKDSFNGAQPIRYLPVPNGVMLSTEGGPQYFGGPPKDNGPHFMSMKTLVNALNFIDTADAKIDDESDIEFISQTINSLTDEEKAALSEEKVKFFLLEKTDVTQQFENFTTIAITTMKADDNNTINSATLAVKMKKEAEKYGATKIVLVSEGTSKRMSSWGVGLGFSQNYGFVNSGNDGRGGASAGGTGWSWGESEFFSLPYLTAILGY
jgi:hypothetical protein